MPNSPEIVIVEAIPRWEAELRRAYPTAGERITGFASRKEFSERIGASAIPLLIIALSSTARQSQESLSTDDLQESRGWLPSLSALLKRPGRGEVVVIADQGLRDLEFPLREQGLTYFLPESHETVRRIVTLAGLLLSVPQA